MLDYSAVNWVAVVVAAIANLVINTVWYMPMLFGKQWGALTGRSPSTMGNATNYVVAVVGALISAYVLAVLAKAVGVGSLADGAVLGLVAWFGFQATVTAVGGMFEGRPWTLWAINAGAGAVAYLAMGAIIGAIG